MKFVINRDGSVGTSADGGSDLPDQSVTQCVIRGFSNLSFPQPEGGIVTVVYHSSSHRAISNRHFRTRSTISTPVCGFFPWMSM